MSKLGHVYICDACATLVGLRETFLMIVGARPCEGCGTTIGYEFTRESVPTVDGGTFDVPRWGRLVANCMQMWRTKMWPVALGIAIQDFAGAHVHDWSVTYWNGMTGEQREMCRCREQRTTQGRKLASADT